MPNAALFQAAKNEHRLRARVASDYVRWQLAEMTRTRDTNDCSKPILLCVPRHNLQNASGGGIGGVTTR